MKNIKNILFTLIAVASTAFCLSDQGQTCSVPRVITIFVHGTKPQMIPDIFYKFGQYFFKPGLHHVDKQSQKYGPKGIIKGLKDSDYVDLKHLYFFGWSGILNNEEHRNAALTLLEEIEKLTQIYIEKYGVAPKFHIIGHSHGGNIGLHLAHELEAKESAIILDEIILLGTPADQAWTKEYIKSKNVDKIYHYYSVGDLIQVADPQGMQIHFHGDVVTEKPKFFERSKHTFDHHENLTQLEIKINDIDPWHITFIDYYPPKFKDWVKYLVKDSQHTFPRFLPELGDIMRKVKATDVQERIQQHKKPITVNIDTHKAQGDNERIKISHPKE